MKILLVRNYATEVNLKNYNLQEIGIAKALVKRGHQCDVLYYTSDKNRRREVIEVEENKVNIYFEPAIKIMHNAIYLRLLYNNFFSSYEVIQTSEYHQIMTLLLTLKYKNKVVLFHGPYSDGVSARKKIFHKIYDFLFIKTINNRLKGIISKSCLATEYLFKKGFKNISTLGVGLDEDKIRSSGVFKNSKIVKETKDNFLLFVGQLNERKNILFMLKILKNILKINLNFKLILVGEGNQYDMGRYKKYINENKLEKNVVFLGKIEQIELEEIYKLADGFLFPSKEEIFGMVLLESMYFGVPVFSSVHGGSSTVIKNNVNGFMFENYDIEIWSKKILEIIENDDLKGEIAFQATKIIEKKFLWKTIIENYIKVYEGKKVSQNINV